MIVSSELGNSPWTVLAEGVAVQTVLAIGAATVAISFLVLLMWIPLRQRLGLGTILNAIVIGVAIDVSLALLDALHVRWSAFLRGLSPVDFQRSYLHPELGVVPLDVAIGIYAWHGKHHTAHITNAPK